MGGAEGQGGMNRQTVPTEAEVDQIVDARRERTRLLLRQKSRWGDGKSRMHGVIDTTTAAPGGHGHGAAQHAARLKRVPEWALNDAKLRRLMLHCFPKMDSDPEQRRLAGRKLRIIHLYYKVGLTAATVAVVLGVTRRTVKRIIENSEATAHRLGLLEP